MLEHFDNQVSALFTKSLQSLTWVTYTARCNTIILFVAYITVNTSERSDFSRLLIESLLIGLLINQLKFCMHWLYVKLTWSLISSVFKPWLVPASLLHSDKQQLSLMFAFDKYAWHWIQFRYCMTYDLRVFCWMVRFKD